jgi:hypothetical protein
MAIEHPAVNYVVTVPGFAGAGIAFAAEACISFGLMLVVLIVSNHTKLNAWTGVFAGVLVASYITVEAPLSGMSMNPARSFASALPAQRRSSECCSRRKATCGSQVPAASFVPSSTTTTTHVAYSFATTMA